MNRVDKPNEPLTLEQLKQMDGEPVYVVEAHGRAGWNFRRNNGFDDCCGEFIPDVDMNWDSYGSLWLAYRNKLEEEQP